MVVDRARPVGAAARVAIVDLHLVAGADRSLPLATRELVVKRSELGDRAGVVGAGVMVTDELFRPAHLAQWLGAGTPNGGHVVAAPH